MKKYRLITSPERCAGCLMCKLACSEYYTGRADLARARLDITGSGADRRIEFLTSCTNCGICADCCGYSAIRKVPK